MSRGDFQIRFALAMSTASACKRAIKFAENCSSSGGAAYSCGSRVGEFDRFPVHFAYRSLSNSFRRRLIPRPETLGARYNWASTALSVRPSRLAISPTLQRSRYFHSRMTSFFIGQGFNLRDKAVATRSSNLHSLNLHDLDESRCRNQSATLLQRAAGMAARVSSRPIHAPSRLAPALRPPRLLRARRSPARSLSPSFSCPTSAARTGTMRSKFWICGRSGCRNSTAR